MVHQRFTWYVPSNINENANPVPVFVKAKRFTIIFYQKLRSRKIEFNLVSVMTGISTLSQTKRFNWSNLFDMEFIFRLSISSIFIIKIRILFCLLFIACNVVVTIYYFAQFQQRSLHPVWIFFLSKFVLSSLVSQILLLKIKPFKKSARLLANI